MVSDVARPLASPAAEAPGRKRASKSRTRGTRGTTPARGRIRTCSAGERNRWRCGLARPAEAGARARSTPRWASTREPQRRAWARRRVAHRPGQVMRRGSWVRRAPSSGSPTATPGVRRAHRRTQVRRLAPRPWACPPWAFPPSLAGRRHRHRPTRRSPSPPSDTRRSPPPARAGRQKAPRGARQ